ncbi:MAG: hypothetical protein EHM68_15165 [Lysobacterales bacterium]|nr:MAG: hypothetical protein EHM68_15165 [Xanthomonadales bacterium]
MNILVRSIFAFALLFAATCVHAAPPLPSGTSSPTKIEGYCGENGGTYWPPGPESSTYGCILPDGSVVVCGGSLSGCDTISKAAALPPRLPLAGINLTLQLKGESKLDSMDNKLDSLETMITDLGILVEDECEPPIFVP